MSALLAGHMPWLPPTAKPLGPGARLPVRVWRPEEGDDSRGIRTDYVPVAQRRIAARTGNRCSFCREADGHNRTSCPELAQLRNSGEPWVPR